MHVHNEKTNCIQSPAFTLENIIFQTDEDFGMKKLMMKSPNYSFKTFHKDFITSTYHKYNRGLGSLCFLCDF